MMVTSMLLAIAITVVDLVQVSIADRVQRAARWIPLAGIASSGLLLGAGIVVSSMRTTLWVIGVSAAVLFLLCTLVKLEPAPK